jgi:hypothetical protein
VLFYSTKTLHELAHPQTLTSAIAKRFDHARLKLRRERCDVKRTTCSGLSHDLTILSRNKRHFAPMDLAVVDPYQKLPVGM